MSYPWRARHWSVNLNCGSPTPIEHSARTSLRRSVETPSSGAQKQATEVRLERDDFTLSPRVQRT